MAVCKILDDLEPLSTNLNHLDFTKFDIKTFSHRWNIPRFVFNTMERYEEYIPDYYESTYSWYLRVYPRPDDYHLQYMDYVTIFLYANKHSVNAHCVIELLDTSNNVLLCRSFEHTEVDGNSDEIDSPHACIKSETLQKALEKSINGTLIINCTIIEFADLENEEGESDRPIKKLKDSHSTCVLKTMLTDQIYTDFTINVKGRQFKVHKAVLYTCSPVFATMLSTDMKERVNNEATVDDVEPEVFEKIVEFIYTGNVATINANAMDLVPVAHKYDLKELLKQCEAVLCFQVSMETVVKLFVLSSVYSLKYLKNLSIKYIKVNLKAVVQTADFKTYVENDPKLLMVLLMH